MGVGLRRSALAELIGTALLVATVIGTATAAARMTPDLAMQLFVNSFATGLVLVALILALSPVSAAFNPVVTLAERLFGAITTRVVIVHIAAQLVGACLGALLAAGMFASPVELSSLHRGAAHLLLGEVVATFGLLLVIFAMVHSGRTSQIGFAVGGYIAAAYWFTSSTSFANPAVTVARTLTRSAAGIAPSSVPWFVVAQLVGGAVAVLAIKALYPAAARLADDLAHQEDA